MHAGLHLLRLAPERFWALTPREFAAMTGAYALASRADLARADLDALMARYPDRKTGARSHGR